MAWTTTIGDKFTHSQYLPIIARAITANAHVVSAIDARTTTHPSIHLNREQDSTLDSGGWTDCSTEITSLSMNPTEVTFPVKMYSTRTEICDRSNQYDTYNDQIEVQLNSLMRKAGRGLEWTVINADTGENSNQPKGLKAQVTNTIDATGDALTFAYLDELMRETKEQSANMAFITNPILVDKFRSLARANGYKLDEVSLPNGFMAPSFRGFPIISSEFVYANENDGTDSSVYFVNLDITSGQGFGFYFGMPPAIPDAMEGTGPFSLINAGHSLTLPTRTWQLQMRLACVLHSLEAATRLEGLSTTS